MARATNTRHFGKTQDSDTKTSTSNLGSCTAATFVLLQKPPASLIGVASWDRRLGRWFEPFFWSALGQAAVACRSFACWWGAAAGGLAIFLWKFGFIRTGTSSCPFIFLDPYPSARVVFERPHPKVLLGKEAGLWLGCLVALGMPRVEQHRKHR